MQSTVHVAKTKALISFAVTAKLICAYADRWFCHDAAHVDIDVLTFYRFSLEFMLACEEFLTWFS